MIRRLRQLPFWVVSSFFFLLVTVFLFGDALIDPSRVISARGMDTDGFFYPLRWFSFQQIRRGHFPLWNPFVLGGIPAFGNSMYALLYPPNWLHLIVPLNLMINLTYAVHMMLAGLFTATWCRSRGASRVASLIGGLVFMMSGPNTLRVYGGYLTHPCIIAWTPLLFMCIDAIIERRRTLIACLLGGLVVAMQIFAGYIQPTYFQYFAVASYVMVRLINDPKWMRTIGWLAIMLALGGALSAAQMLPGIDAAMESVRGSAGRGSFSTSFSIAPENVLTLVAPFPFGDRVSGPMFTRWGVVDTSLFIGVVATSLAVLGSIRARSLKDRAALVTAIFMLAMAMGEYNPLYEPLLRIIPGLELFRYPSRFGFMATFMAAPLAAAGFDFLRQTRRITAFTIGVIAAAAGFAIAAIVIANSASSGFDGAWGKVLAAMIRTGETWIKLDDSHAGQIIEMSARFAAQQFADVAGIFALVGLIVVLSRARPAALSLLLLLALTELWTGSVLSWERFTPRDHLPWQWTQTIANLGRDDRVLVMTTGDQNLPMQFGIESIGGYDPAVRERWDSAVRPLLGSESRGGNLNTRRVLPSNRWPLLRLSAVVPHYDIPIDPPMPRLNLICNYIIAPTPDDSLQAMRKPNFDPRKTVVLEQSPVPAPTTDDADRTAGTVELIQFNTDSLEISAQLERPAILLVSDAWSKGWRVRPLETGSQASYQVMPADHALRAIPLAAGKHHFVLEYWPMSVPVGFTISGAALLGYAVAFIALLVRSRRRPRLASTM